VLFMTAREDAASRTRGRRLGAVAYLTKPFDPTELTRHVRTALRMQQAGGPANAAKPL
jgi:DNA-binding response OmpR family regulator